MKQLIAHFRVVTPLFLGGANPKEVELRPSSIKGALRFWWRALQWKKGVTDVGNLKQKEDSLFGSSERGQSRFLLSLGMDKATPSVIEANNLLGANGKPSQSRNDIVGDGARYLGYGLMDAFNGRNSQAGKLSRPCFAAPFAFSVRIVFKSSVAETEIEEIADALKLLGLCGGLGSRSRRGWGSVTLTQLEYGDKPWKAPTAIATYAAEILNIIGKQDKQTSNGSDPLPQWTAFATGKSKVVLLQDKQTSPLETLAKMGKDFVFYRSWGRNGEVLREKSEKNFPFDHDLFKKSNGHNRDTEHPQRIVFGLPQNYGKYEQDQVIPVDSLTRRASPLFFHVHQVSDHDAPIGVLTYLPAVFLPDNHNAVKFGGDPVPIGQNGGIDFWKPAEDFLERMKNGSGKVQFSKTQEVTL